MNFHEIIVVCECDSINMHIYIYDYIQLNHLFLQVLDTKLLSENNKKMIYNILNAIIYEEKFHLCY